MHYLDLRVCAVAEGTVTLADMTYLGATIANFGVLGPHFRRFGIEITVFDCYVTK